MYKTEGYTPDAGSVGPITILRTAPLDDSRARSLQAQAENTKNPVERQRLLMLAALEAKYAQTAQQAQQGVQDAAIAPGGDLIYGSPQQSMAKMARGRMRQQAAEEYNRSLPAGYMGLRRDTSYNPFYGA